ncbi:MAG TPA: ATP-binding protein, partial [Anaerolineaceae bacterium]
PENSPETGILRVMEQEVERMASLVANLLQFSRPGQRQISSLDLREEIEKTLELINNQLVHRQIILQRVFAPDLPLVQADRQQVRQLLLNLVSNASDAMPSGGVLTITAQPESGGKKVRIEIQDTGIGIPARELEKILEPFYTTKPEGKGTGLGLAICRRIVEEHHGTLTVTSPGLGKGATVRIILPAANGSPSSILPD